MNARPLRLSTAQADFETLFQQRLHWSADTDAAIEQRVADILADVKARGDAAVLDYTARFDGLQAASMAELELQQSDFKAAFDGLPEAQKRALQDAAARIRSYHEAQKKACGESWQYRDADGSLLGQKVTPLDRAGIYVPGGKAAYPSSLLMNAIPAHVAGVGEIIMVVPTPVLGSVATGGAAGSGTTATRGERNELVLAAAYVAGVSRAFTIGGAQAVAAMASAGKGARFAWGRGLRSLPATGHPAGSPHGLPRRDGPPASAPTKTASVAHQCGWRHGRQTAPASCLLPAVRGAALPPALSLLTQGCICGDGEDDRHGLLGGFQEAGGHRR